MGMALLVRSAGLSGVEATDWSWGALIFDMDNDGLKDIFVANGIYQDLTNQDYLQYVSNHEIVKRSSREIECDTTKCWLNLFPRTRFRILLFKIRAT